MKKSKFFVLCLAKSDISEENKCPRTKIMRTKIIGSKISYLVKAIEFFLGGIVFKIFSNSSILSNKTLGIKKFIYLSIYFSTVSGNVQLYWKISWNLWLPKKSSCFYQIGNFILYNFGSHLFCSRTFIFLKNVTFRWTQHKKKRFSQNLGKFKLQLFFQIKWRSAVCSIRFVVKRRVSLRRKKIYWTFF